MLRNYISGRDLHGCPVEVAQFTNVPIGLIRRSLVLLWLEFGNNEAEAKQ
jgi:hypothetical protein